MLMNIRLIMNINLAVTSVWMPVHCIWSVSDSLGNEILEFLITFLSYISEFNHCKGESVYLSYDTLQVSTDSSFGSLACL